MNKDVKVLVAGELEAWRPASPCAELPALLRMLDGTLAETKGL
jgi:hypothetical protein